MEKQAIPLEKTITNHIVQALKKQGVTFLFKSHGGSFQGAGLPDIVLIAPENGRFVGLEVKRPHLGRLSPLQKAVLSRINQSGGYGVVVTSPEDALLAVEMAGKGRPAPIGL